MKGSSLKAKIFLSSQLAGIFNCCFKMMVVLVRYNSRLIDYSNANAYIYTFHEAVSYQPFRLPIYSYSYYLFTIILTDYSNTWNNKRLGLRHIVARMDRFLVQDSFLLLGLNSTSKMFPFGGSNHKPILLEMRNDKNIIPIPFRVSPLWVAHKDFLGIVADAWLPPVMSS